MPAIRRAVAHLLAGVALGGATLLPIAPGRAGAANEMTPWTLPTRPPSCTNQQLATGALAGCLNASSWGDPDQNGWPSPPFPSDPATGAATGVVPLAGWTWSGYAYNGSPALAGWEPLLASNHAAIGRVRAGQLKVMPEALPLFEGFLREIVAGGYRVADAYTYSFRCTSGSGKSCAGLSRGSLSNHSWGLALDMNSGANPETTYVGKDGASACATPVVTDIPQWVVQTAERWGLYWGGYGYSSGCSSPAEVKASVSRDATHFEFHGSPALASRIAAYQRGGACLPTVDPGGTPTSACLAPGGVPAAGTRVVVDTNAPKGATAALVNIAMTDATAEGYVTADTCGAAPAGARATSNGNTMASTTVSNLSVVALDATGRFCLYRSQPMHTVVDVQGFFAPAAAAGPSGTTFTPATPTRLLDTRTTPACDPSGACMAAPAAVDPATEVAVVASSAPADAVAVLANLAVTEPAAAGYLTADACATLQPGAQTRANANFERGATLSNLAVIPVAPTPAGAQFCTNAMSPVHEVLDLQGWFAPPTATSRGNGFTVAPSARLVDTRGCWSDPLTAVARCAQRTAAGSLVRIAAPVGATAVLVNITLTDATADGFVTAQPCSLLQGVVPGQANGNVMRGRTAGNLAVVGVDPDGTFCVRTSQPTHVVVDLQGTFSPAGAQRFLPITPVRRSDTRRPAGI